jgi:hypothetical protein
MLCTSVLLLPGWHVLAKHLHTLSLAKPHGTCPASQVYMFGHQDASTVATVVSLKVAAVHSNLSSQLQLTEKHFLPVVASSAGEQQHFLHKYAKDVEVGDLLMLAGHGVDGSDAVLGRVMAKTLEQAVGLFNPYTKVTECCMAGAFCTNCCASCIILMPLAVAAAHGMLRL